MTGGCSGGCCWFRPPRSRAASVSLFTCRSRPSGAFLPRWPGAFCRVSSCIDSRAISRDSIVCGSPRMTPALACNAGSGWISTCSPAVSSAGDSCGCGCGLLMADAWRPCCAQAGSMRPPGAGCSCCSACAGRAAVLWPLRGNTATMRRVHGRPQVVRATVVTEPTKTHEKAGSRRTFNYRVGLPRQRRSAPRQRWSQPA